jgi:hypothetical protein
MNINAKISLFRNVTDPNPVTEITIHQFIENVIQCDYINDIAAIRSESDKDERDKLKKKLPCFTISGTFSKRGNQYLKQHSGFICIDIDEKGNEHITDWSAFRDSISDCEVILFAALSVSGRGVFFLIPLAYPHKHLEQFKALELQFKEMGIIIDPICKDVARLRGISSDLNAVVNLNAKPYRKVIIEQPLPQYNGKTSPDLQKLIAWVESKHGSFCKGNRNNYVTQLTGACHRFGLSQSEVEAYGRTLAQSDFTENEIQATIRSIYANQRWHSKAITN